MGCKQIKSRTKKNTSHNRSKSNTDMNISKDIIQQTLIVNKHRK